MCGTACRQDAAQHAPAPRAFAGAARAARYRRQIHTPVWAPAGPPLSESRSCSEATAVGRAKSPMRQRRRAESSPSLLRVARRWPRRIISESSPSIFRVVSESSPGSEAPPTPSLFRVVSEFFPSRSSSGSEGPAAPSHHTACAGRGGRTVEGGLAGSGQLGPAAEMLEIVRPQLKVGPAWRGQVSWPRCGGGQAGRRAGRPAGG